MRICLDCPAVLESRRHRCPDCWQAHRRAEWRREDRISSPGKPYVTVGRRATVLERFWIKVQRDDEGCWAWIGSRNGKGYALFEVAGRGSKRAHRWAYEHFIGPIPDGLTIDHLCLNKSCVNPHHLEPVTNAENQRRRLARDGERLAA